MAGSPATLALLACSLGAALAVADQDPGSRAVRVVIEDPSRWHTYPPGAPFRVDVHVAGSNLQGARIAAQWVDAHRQPIGDPIPVTAAARSISAPSGEPGFYGLVFSSPDPQVAFPPQAAGLPSSVYGFAVIPDPPTGTPEMDEASPFGVVQGNVEDPYLRSGSGPGVSGVHLKTKTWNQSPRSWRGSIEQRAAAGHTEMPLINNRDWRSEDRSPIPAAQLDALGAKFDAVLGAEPALVKHWQAGLEENRDGGRRYGEPHYFSNLREKMTRLRAVAEPANPQVEFFYSTRGHDMRVFEQLFASEAFGLYSGLAHNPYRWPDFPAPEEWLPAQVRDLRTRLDTAGHPGHRLWFGELGIPVRGPNDPDAFYGYPESRNAVPGASLDYAASYLVKCHALALAAGIERIYVYNYQNRGNDIDYAEHHFGLRSYSEPRSDPGHPLPAYVAYINMLAHLKGSAFTGHSTPTPDVHVFEFAVTGTAERRVLAWVHPGRSLTLPLSTIAADLRADAVDLYGAPSSAIDGARITLSGRPVYLRY